MKKENKKENTQNKAADNQPKDKDRLRPALSVVNLVIITGIIFIGNLLLNGYFFRLDLTKEKRYTLSKLTKQTADTLNAILTVKIYLEGDFHPVVKRYRDAIKTTLLELKARSGKYIQYQFINPSDDTQLQQFLVQSGVQPIPVNFKGEDGESIQKWIFPGAVLTYQGKEEVINLLQTDCAVTSKGVECDYQKAESEIEYKLISSIRRMFRTQKPLVGLLKGHGEYNVNQMQEFTAELKKFYEVVEINVKKGQAIPPAKKQFDLNIQKKVDGEGFDILIIAQPDSAFTEREKYQLDQYVMMGGKILWLMDQVRVDEKDFQTELGATVTEGRNLNLNDLCFKYGFKVENNLIQDDIAGIKAVTTNYDGKPRIIPRKWTYFPMIVNFPIYPDPNAEIGNPDSSGHPIVRNVNMSLLRYASGIEVIKTPGIRATPFMTSSEFSRPLNNPVRIDLDQTISQPPPKKIYGDKGLKTVGVALEGTFQSIFNGREAPVDSFAKEKPKAKFFPQSVIPTRMVVISDGAIVLPNHEPRLGSNNMPGDNKTLLMNAIEWLINDPSYTEMRAKRPAIYALSGKHVQGNERLIRTLNLGIPIVITFLLGTILFKERKRRNTR